MAGRGNQSAYRGEAMKFFVVIKRESRKGIILRVQREKAAIPWGYRALEGRIQAASVSNAVIAVKHIIKNSLMQLGLHEGGAGG